MAADAMLDLKKKISETAEDRNLVLVSILLFYTLWKSSNMMLYVCSNSMFQKYSMTSVTHIVSEKIILKINENLPNMLTIYLFELE